MTPKIEKQIVKYISKSASTKDLDELSEWIQNSNNKTIFKNYVKTHYIINYAMNNSEQDRAVERLLREIKKEKSLVYKLKKLQITKYVAAATVIGIISTTFFLKDNLNNNDKPVINNVVIQSGSDKATLTLENGETITLAKGTKYQTQNAKSNGEKIVYQEKTLKKDKIAYNYLTVPRGGQFQITLSDGTKVWLNSESQLKYPTSFIKGETRRVELVYGEAFFEVSPSSEHKGAKFKVDNAAQEVEVLGTEFNIKAYKDEVNVYTTLVEGKVAINLEDNKQLLSPGQQLNLDINTKNSTVKVVDVEGETSWRNGVFSFRGKPLKEVMKIISRWYDVDVIFENKELELTKFRGVLGRHHSIEKILSIMSSNTINSYEIEGKTIILK